MKATEKKSRHWRNGGEKTKESECTSKKEGESRERRKENFDTWLIDIPQWLRDLIVCVSVCV